MIIALTSQHWKEKGVSLKRHGADAYRPHLARGERRKDTLKLLPKASEHLEFMTRAQCGIFPIKEKQGFQGLSLSPREERLDNHPNYSQISLKNYPNLPRNTSPNSLPLMHIIMRQQSLQICQSQSNSSLKSPQFPHPFSSCQNKPIVCSNKQQQLFPQGETIRGFLYGRFLTTLLS